MWGSPVRQIFDHKWAKICCGTCSKNGWKISNVQVPKFAWFFSENLAQKVSRPTVTPVRIGKVVDNTEERTICEFVPVYGARHGARYSGVRFSFVWNYLYKTSGLRRVSTCRDNCRLVPHYCQYSGADSRRYQDYTSLSLEHTHTHTDIIQP